MDYKDIVKLFQDVLDMDIYRYQIPLQDICIGIESMAHIYRPVFADLSSERSVVADFSDVAHRCGYLHKYAAFHTAMVRDMLLGAIKIDKDFFSRCIFARNNFKICSLGGGPGSDIIGVLLALYEAFPYFSGCASVTIVDYMVNWSYTFDAVLKELRSGWYGRFGETIKNLSSHYIGANLLTDLTDDVKHELSEASLVTMVKFASAAACQDTEFMLQNIFYYMKPGALALYIDNDGGGFHDVLLKASKKYNYISIHGPHRHVHYVNNSIKLYKFGYNSCASTTVTLHILQKPFITYMPHTPLQRSPSLEQMPCEIDSPIRDTANQSKTPLEEMPPEIGLVATPVGDTANQSKTSLEEMPPEIGSLMATPIGDIANQSKTPVFTPVSGSSKCRKRKHAKQNCLQMPFNKLRHKVAIKAKRLKFQLRAASNKIKKAVHPIFKM